MKTVTRPWAIALSALTAVGASGCKFKVDIEHSHFVCVSAAECGEGQVCVVQAGPWNTGRGVCFTASQCSVEVCDEADNDCDGLVDNGLTEPGKACDTGLPGECKPGVKVCANGKLFCRGTSAQNEACNGKDDDCDGQTDEGYSFLVDSANCGVCGRVCPAGSGCAGGVCSEYACSDGADNDKDSTADCMDTDCDTAVCAPNGKRCAAKACACPGAEAQQETTCYDKLDNDCDGLFDCDDLDCIGRQCVGGVLTKTCGKPPGATAPSCVDREAVCSDKVDNDGDGKTDCLDDDCEKKPCGTGCECRSLVAEELDCTNGVDDDGDGKKDCDDSDCTGLSCSASDSSKNCGKDAGGAAACVARETSCSDGIDNDGDGKKDCEDVDCKSRSCDAVDSTKNCGTDAATKLACVPNETVCNDAFDNDGDGKKDCEEDQCAGAACVGGAGDPTRNCGKDAAGTRACVMRELSLCADGLDNDGDGATDCADPDCRGYPCASGKNCGKDPAAPNALACVPVESACTDDLDNDGDGTKDCLDSDCGGFVCNKAGGGTGNCIQGSCQ